MRAIERGANHDVTFPVHPAIQRYVFLFTGAAPMPSGGMGMPVMGMNPIMAQGMMPMGATLMSPGMAMPQMQPMRQAFFPEHK